MRRNEQHTHRHYQAQSIMELLEGIADLGLSKLQIDDLLAILGTGQGL
jgi:hypothetical protein